MAQVSVADVDNLKDILSLISTSYSLAKEAFDRDLANLNQLHDQAEKNCFDSAKSLEQAQSEVSRLEQQMEGKGQELSEAEADLSEAQDDLASAQNGDDDTDDDEIDTSSEEAAVAAAEDKVAEIQNEIDELKSSLEQAREIQAKCEVRVALAQEAMQKIEQQKDNFEVSQSFHLREIEDLLSVAETRISAAQNALNEYLAANPPVAQFEKWLHWSPQDKQIITPKEIHDRLNLSGNQLDLSAKYLYDRDRAFQSRIDHYREQYKAARGSAEELAVFRQARRGGAGDFAEKLVALAFQPTGTISTQERTVFDDGKSTKTDLFASNLKVPFVAGRGPGMSAPVGGSVAIEVKTGKPDYLYRQKEHMEFQAKGHERANVSMTICSRDIKSLSPEKEAELRSSLKAAGSPILGMLPSKDELDGAFWRLIIQSKD